MIPGHTVAGLFLCPNLSLNQCLQEPPQILVNERGLDSPCLKNLPHIPSLEEQRYS